MINIFDDKVLRENPKLLYLVAIIQGIVLGFLAGFLFNEVIWIGSCDLEQGELVCPNCGNNDIYKFYIEPLGFQCELCGYDSRK